MINLTEAESKWIIWSLDAMECLPEYEKVEILGSKLPTLPQIHGGQLRIDGCSEDVIEDLLYRLEEQAFDVSGTDSYSHQQQYARWRPAQRAAEKIRKAYNKED